MFSKRYNNLYTVHKRKFGPVGNFKAVRNYLGIRASVEITTERTFRTAEKEKCGRTDKKITLLRFFMPGLMSVAFQKETNETKKEFTDQK